MRPISQAMQQVTLDPGANPVVIVEARVEQTADIRQRSDQWAQADGGLSANLEVLADGGLRLKPTAGAAAGPTVQNAWFRPKEPGNTGIFVDFFDPIGNPIDHIIGLRGQWNGTAANVAYSQVQAWLNPRFDTTKPKLVQTWQLVIYQLVYRYLPSVSGALTLSYSLAPVATAQVAALGEAAGWVVFTFQDASGKLTPWHPERYLQPLLPGTNISEQVGPEYFISCSGQDAKGHRVFNVAWGYDNTQTQFASGGVGNQIVLTAASFGNTPTLPALPTFRTPAGLPALQFIPVSYASTATITLKTTAPIDVGVTPTDASLVEFIVQPEVPLGTSVLAEAAVDPAGAFTAVKSGQSAAAIALAAQRKYDMRATLSANANADRTPILRLLGARLVAAVDLGNTVEVIELNEHTDPITHQSEVESCVIRCYHDGERDYRDPISLLLSQNPPGQFSFRLYVGDRRLPKDQWVYHDDFYPQDVELQDAYTDIHCVSCLSQMKQELPVLSSDAVAAPTSTSSNPGAWTSSTGTDLAAQIADLPEPQWAATTAYIVGSRVIDANSNVQVATVAGTSGGSAPSWGTALSSYTVDGGVTWQNLGVLASGLPDDTTYIQSPNNPSNADYIVNLGKIGTPQQSVGATIQFRAATVGAAQSLTCTVILREGTTPRATKAVTVNVQDTGQGSYLVFQYLLTAAEQASIGNWGNLNFLIRANGTGGIRVGWARLVVLGRRAPYVSSAIGTSAQQIMDDLINNQVALDARLKGPQYADKSPAIVVSKTIEQDPSGVTDLARSLDELQRLAWITGTFYMSTQGRLTNRPLYQVSTGTDPITGTTTATYMPLISPIRAILGPGEVEPIAITPGWRQRIPLFRVPWGWNGKNWGGEAQVVNAPALTYYRPDLIEADPRCPTETSKWISGQGLGNGLSARHGQMFGLGLMEWRFRCIYPHPEWERGDVVTLPTDRFLAYDPISTRALAGRQWATGVIVGRHDALGREWSIWIQTLSAIRPIAGALAYLPFNAMDPIVGRPIWRDNRLFVHANTQSGVSSIKVATSTSSYPAAGSGTSTDGSDILFDAGTFPYWSTVYVTITGYSDLGGTGIQRSVTQFTTKLPGLRWPEFNPHQMLPNAGFEDGLVFFRQQAGNAGAVVVVTDSTKAHGGNKYLQVTSATGVQTVAEAADDASASRYFEVSPGDVVQWGGYAHRESGTDNVNIILQSTDKDFGAAANAFTPNQNTAAYLLVEGQYVVPAGVKYVRWLCQADGSGTATVARFDDVYMRIAFRKSTVHNPQGSIPPTVGLLSGDIAYNTGGSTNGHMWACFNTPGDLTLRRPDGSTPTAYSTTGYDRPAAPTLSQVAAGVLGARTRFVRVALAKLNGTGLQAAASFYRTSTESSLAVNANNLLKVTSPAAVAGYDGYVVLVGATTNNEVAQGIYAGTLTNAVIPFGTDWTEPTAGAATSSTTNTPYNSVMDSGFTMPELSASQTLKAYLYWDATVGSGGIGTTGAFRCPALANVLSAVSAQQQNGDGMIPMSFGATSVVTPAAGGSNPGTTGGGRYL